MMVPEISGASICDICTQGCIIVLVQDEGLPEHRAEHLRDAWLAAVAADGESVSDEDKTATEVAESTAYAAMIAWIDANHLDLFWDPRRRKTA